MAPRARHFRNLGQGGQTVFVTTTCLDFVHVFADPVLADLMAACIADECKRTESFLHAFVVMPHHLHLLATPPVGLSITDFVRRLKSGSARRIRPRLTAGTLSQFAAQSGLNRHVFWQRSIRSYVVSSPEQFHQKMDYIHDNPRRGGLVDNPADYRWSSFRFYVAGHGTHLHELNLESLALEFAPGGLPSVSEARNAKPQ